MPAAPAAPASATGAGATVPLTTTSALFAPPSSLLAGHVPPAAGNASPATNQPPASAPATTGTASAIAATPVATNTPLAPLTRQPSGADFVEKSPQGHYAKFREVLGKGAFKTVYKAQDLEHGNLVAWNEVNIKMYAPKERKRILNEVTLLKKLSHPNLIAFYGAWVNKESEKVVFITELMSSGTLKEFCAKYPISCRQIKKYCRCVGVRARQRAEISACSAMVMVCDDA